MLDGEPELLIVTDLKQYAFCPRVVYFEQCLPDLRPLTHKMEAGHIAHERELRRAARRSLQRYGLGDGEREFGVRLRSERLGLVGKIDEVVISPEPPVEVYPVDYKLTRRVGTHHKLQIAAYALLLEEAWGVEIDQGFVYLIPTRKAEPIRVDESLRGKLYEALEAVCAIAHREQMPDPPHHRARCVDCEFRRLCNDF